MGLIKGINDGWHLQKEFEIYGRDYYSSDAYYTMVEYFDSLGKSVELDVIALCDEFTEYNDPWEVIEEYDLKYWIDNVDLSNVTLTINDWIELTDDKEYLYECLPEELCYYDKEIGNYVIPDYNRMVSLDDMSDYGFSTSTGLSRHSDFQEIINENVDKQELFELVTDELNDHTTAWNLGDSVLFIEY